MGSSFGIYPYLLREEIIMPAVSKQQQKFMGLVYALKKGDIKPSDVSQDVRDAAKSMTTKQSKDFASTEHKGLPTKKESKFEEAMERLIKKVDEDWSEKYKRSIDCNNPKGFSQKAHCAGRKK